MTRTIQTRISIIIILSTLITTLGCKPVNQDFLGKSLSFFAFNTVIQITLYDSDNTELLNECQKKCEYYESIFSKTMENSDIFKINSANTEPVNVSEETLYLIKKAGEYYRLSDGLFDITISPLSDLWTSYRDNSLTPEPDKIEACLPYVNYSLILIDEANQTVTKADKNIKLDLGGLAKGYIADALKEYLISEGVNSAIINLGGNIVTIGTKPDGTPFKIGIKEPFTQNRPVASVASNDNTIVTSGVYERYYTNSNTIYHHIINPATGYPSTTDLISTTIISRSSLEADALSTICILSGLEKAKEIINNTPNTEAVFITSDNKLHLSNNASNYVSY